MRIRFLGAAREVTGSCFLLEGAGVRFLIDCGMFQGGREAYRRNLSALDFGFPLKALDFVILTHAHIDHSGLLPRLSALGFRGPVYATQATCDLAEVLLLDSAHIQEKEAEWENRHHRERHARLGRERAPLYTVNQARQCLKQLRPCAYDTEWQPVPDIRVMFRDAGHILGSAITELSFSEDGRVQKVVISGDLGQPNRPVLNDPTPIAEADVLLVESTYGNRLHKNMADTVEELVGAFEHTLKRKHGNIVLPAFAVGRTQEVLFILTDLVRRGRLAPMTIHVDSPMAEAATRLTLKHQNLLDAVTRDEMFGEEWPLMWGLRNRIAHGYASVDHARLWAERPDGIAHLDRARTCPRGEFTGRKQTPTRILCDEAFAELGLLNRNRCNQFSVLLNRLVVHHYGLNTREFFPQAGEYRKSVWIKIAPIEKSNLAQPADLSKCLNRSAFAENCKSSGTIGKRQK